MADGFLGRWSRRKLDVKAGKPVEEPAPSTLAPAAPAAAVAGSHLPAGEQAVVAVPEQQAPADAGQAQEAPPTLADVQSLTPESDFRRFVQPGVSPEVKNAAIKKLWADPRFNIQDGLDVYIDDYSKPDPMPESMLRQLVAGQFLGLFREEERKDEPEGGTRDDAEGQPPHSVAQSQPPAEELPPSPPAVPPESHAHADLRLQQDDAAGPQPAGRGAG